jgi:hypothetical protein
MALMRNLPFIFGIQSASEQTAAAVRDALVFLAKLPTSAANRFCRQETIYYRSQVTATGDL